MNRLDLCLEAVRVDPTFALAYNDLGAILSFHALVKSDYLTLPDGRDMDMPQLYCAALNLLPPDDPHHGAPITLDAGRSVLLLTDGLRTRSDFNHGSGLNRMFGDLSVEWWADTANHLRDSLPETALATDPGGQDRYSRIWEFLNEPNSTLGP